MFRLTKTGFFALVHSFCAKLVARTSSFAPKRIVDEGKGSKAELMAQDKLASVGSVPTHKKKLFLRLTT